MKKIFIFIYFGLLLVTFSNFVNADIIYFDQNPSNEVLINDFSNSEVNSWMSTCNNGICEVSENFLICPLDCKQGIVTTTIPSTGGGGGAGSILPNYSYPYINPYANPNKTNIINQTVNVVKKVPWYTIPIFIVVLFLTYRFNLKRGMRKARKEEERKKQQEENQ